MKFYIQRIILGGLGLLLAGTSLSASPRDTKDTPTRGTGVHPVGLHLGGSAYTLLDFGFIGKHRPLRGLSVNALGNSSHYGGSGMILGALYIVNRGKTFRGFSVASVTNTLYHTDATGVQMAGLVTVAGTTRGLQISGMNLTERLYGAQVELVNTSLTEARGLQLGFTNITGSAERHLQIGVTNIATRLQSGLQLGLINHRELGHALQIGSMNIASAEAMGVQVGLVNLAGSSQLTQIGLANIRPTTHLDFFVGAGTMTKANIGLRLRNELFYAILGTGFYYRGLDDSFSGAIYYRRGLRLRLLPRLWASGDLGFAHIEDTPREPGSRVANRHFALQARLSLEYELGRHWGLYATGGYSFVSQYRRDAEQEHKPLWEGGLLLYL